MPNNEVIVVHCDTNNVIVDWLVLAAAILEIIKWQFWPGPMGCQYREVLLYYKYLHWSSPQISVIQTLAY
jgi:hypothetical protein